MELSSLMKLIKEKMQPLGYMIIESANNESINIVSEEALTDLDRAILESFKSYLKNLMKMFYHMKLKDVSIRIQLENRTIHVLITSKYMAIISRKKQPLRDVENKIKEIFRE